jgi:hypothetical protein
MDSGATTRTTTPDLTTLLWRALVLPCGPLLRTSHPHQGGLQRYHVSHGTGPHFRAREGSGATTRPAVPCGPCTSSIKKGLASLAMQLDSRVFIARSRVARVFPRHARVFRRRLRLTNYTLQDMWTGGYSVTPALLTTHKTQLQWWGNPTGRRHTADRVRRGKVTGQDTHRVVKDII